MDFTIERGALVRELAVAERVVARKVTLPVLSAVLMRAEKGMVHLSATDIDLAVQASCAADVASPGLMAVPVVRLHELARSFAGDKVRLSLNGGSVSVAAGAFKGQLQVPPADDFPSIASPEPGAASVVLPRRVLRGLILRTRFAMTSDDKRYFLAGAKLEVGVAGARMVTSDGHRLALAEAKLQAAPPSPVEALVPKKAVDTLASMLEDDDEGDVVWSVGGNHLFFGVDDRVLVTRRVEGEFPAYDRIMPKSYKVTAEADRGEMAGALRRASLVTDATSHRVDLSFGDTALTVSAESAEVGCAAEPVATRHAGGALALAANGDYIADFLEAAGTERVLCRMNNETGAMCWSAVGGDYRYECIVMPVRK